jgi:hypothetical protein
VDSYENPQQPGVNSEPVSAIVFQRYGNCRGAWFNQLAMESI